MTLVLKIICFLLVFVGVSVLAFFIGRSSSPDNSNRIPKNAIQLFDNWRESIRPPGLDEEVVVYVSAPLFNLSENLYAIGMGGLLPQFEESLVDTFCNLTDQELEAIENVGKSLKLPKWGLAGLIAQEGWGSYIPARDGFVLARFITAVVNEAGKTVPVVQVPLVINYLVKAIYSLDCFGLSSVCNTCIFNDNGLVTDSGSAAENGMCALKGMPMVYFKSQVNSDFGGANNPMQIGNASSIISQISYHVQDAVSNLKQKVANIISVGENWWSGLNYTSTIPSPPLIQFWTDVGEAVFLTRYKTKKIVVDPNTGIQDKQASCTDFFYQNYYVKGTDASIATIALEIMKNIQLAETRWAKLIPIWAGCASPESVTLKDIQNNPNICAPGIF